MHARAALCPRIDIKAVTCSHLAILGESQLREVVEMIKVVARGTGVLAMTPADVPSSQADSDDMPMPAAEVSAGQVASLTALLTSRRGRSCLENRDAPRWSRVSR